MQIHEEGKGDGDVLVFLPGQDDIEALSQLLRENLATLRAEKSRYDTSAACAARTVPTFRLCFAEVWCCGRSKSSCVTKGLCYPLHSLCHPLQSCRSPQPCFTVTTSDVETRRVWFALKIVRGGLCYYMCTHGVFARSVAMQFVTLRGGL